MKRLLLFTVCLANFCYADVKLASTTSTLNSGLYDYLLPLMEADTGESISVIAVGTGQALKLGENGDADLLIVHAPSLEKAFIAAGHGKSRQPFMYNEFVVVGPKTDPAGAKSAATAAEALAAIAAAGQNDNAQFISRGDNSGTHVKERMLWKSLAMSPQGRWYLSTGSGMGATLNIAAANDAYALTDSSTWLSFGNKQNLAMLVDGDPALFNQYSVILLPKDRHPHLQADAAQRIANWLISDKGQQAINAFRINGKQAFTANFAVAKAAAEKSP